MNYEDFKKELFLNDPELEKEYNDSEAEYNIIKCFIGARIEKGMTQKELAKECGLKQSHISRFESGNYNPSLKFMEKIAKALDLEISVNKKALGVKPDTETETFSNVIEFPPNQSPIESDHETTSSTSETNINIGNIIPFDDYEEM